MRYLKTISKCSLLLLLCGCSQTNTLDTAINTLEHDDYIGCTYTQYNDAKDLERDLSFSANPTISIDSFNTEDYDEFFKECKISKEEFFEELKSDHEDMYNMIVEFLHAIKPTPTDKNVGVRDQLLIFTDSTYRIVINRNYEIKLYEFDEHNKAVKEENYILSEESKRIVDDFIEDGLAASPLRLNYRERCGR